MIEKYNNTYRIESTRLKNWDYAKEGAYFITICTDNHRCMFGGIGKEMVILNEHGKIVDKCWNEIPKHFPHIVLNEYVIMPNHLHGIIYIRRDTACRVSTLACRQPTLEQFGKPVCGSIPTIVRSFKSAVTKCINETQKTPGAIIWQRNYYDHIIRGEYELNRIREYMINNPSNWDTDRNNPKNWQKEELN
jgi:REP element-mobilizing transposase RayT